MKVEAFSGCFRADDDQGGRTSGDSVSVKTVSEMFSEDALLSCDVLRHVGMMRSYRSDMIAE